MSSRTSSNRNRSPKPAAAKVFAPPASLHTFPGCNRTALILLLALVLAMFSDLFFSTGRVISNQSTDLASQFVAWREFAVKELSAGHLPLWNPHIFSGAPFLGGFQAALLYPPNALYLVLPLAMAINVGIALHVYLLGAFLFLWARERGQSPLAAFVAGALMMFCGAHFPHVFAGHLPNLCTMAWAPLLFLAIDRTFSRRRWQDALLGMFALAMMLLAGHPQYVFYTGVAAGIYTVLCWVRSEERPRTALLLAALVVGGAALAAAQLGAGLQATGETIRSKGVTMEFAAMFSFPPENILTMLVPNFFGKITGYWGRCYLWEMSVFITATGLFLAIYGAVCAPAGKRRWAGTMALALFVLALGAHTPLFSFLFHYVPGFGKFRGMSKFTFQASLFLALLAGAGLDALIERGKVTKPLLGILCGLALFLAFAGLWIEDAASPYGWIPSAMKWMSATQECYLPLQASENAAFLRAAGESAAWSLWGSAGAIALVTIFVGLLQKDRRWIHGLAALVVIEGFVFAHGLRDTFELAAVRSPELEKFITEHRGEDIRTLNLLQPNLAMSLGTYDMWGYDPNIVTRYAEWMTFTQGENPDTASQNLAFRKLSPLYPMLRCKYAFTNGEGGKLKALDVGQPLPHALLVGGYHVLPDRDSIFRAMAAPDFDPAREAMLETEPTPKPLGKEGSLKVTASTTDSLTIEADVPQPTLAIVTDLWTSGWRVRDLAGGHQYELLPANYILRAIPLMAGKHRFIVEYAPLAWRVGVWISILTWIGYAGAWAALWKARSVRTRAATL